MRVKPLQVLWHNKLSIFSADFQPVPPSPTLAASEAQSNEIGERVTIDRNDESLVQTSCSGRLATCGADGFVRLWRINPEQPHPVEFLASLQRHVGGVNVVRWSPNGNYLASAGDDGSICVWRQAETGGPQQSRFGAQDEDEDQKEQWILHCVLPGPREVVIYDLAWSPDGQYLIAGSDMDNSARIWNLIKRKQIQVLDRQHQHFVQGVAWDPLGEYLATQSSDRSLNVFKVKQTAAAGSGEDLSVELLVKSSKVQIPATFAASGKLSANQTPAKPSVPRTPVPALNATPRNPSQAPASVNELMGKDGGIDGEHGKTSEVAEPAAAELDVDVEMMETDTVPIAIANDENSEPPSNLPLPPQTPRTPAVVKRTMKMFHDETVLTFFRRLTFTPDGSLLIAPTGMYRKPASPSGESTVNVTYIYARNSLKSGPCVFLPGYQRPSTLVRCNPVRYQLRKFEQSDNQSSTAVFAMPYRYVFAVGTLDSVFIYDTQQTQPIYQMSNLHYATLNDLAWSSDGRMLIITSADGYCSVACFDQDELGVPLVEL